MATGNNKALSVHVSGSGHVHDINVGPGTKVREVLSLLDLGGYELKKDSKQKPLGEDTDVYEIAEDRGKLYALTPADAGA